MELKITICFQLNQDAAAKAKVEGNHDSDAEFEPDVTSSDDEETIAQEEILNSAATSDGDGKAAEKELAEIENLKRESEIPLEDLLSELPADYFESLGKPELPSESAHQVIISAQGSNWGFPALI